MESVPKSRKHKLRSVTVITLELVQLVQYIIDEDPSKSISRNLQVSECPICRTVHDDIRYKSYLMRRGLFMSSQTREQRFIRAKRLLNKVKHPEILDMLWFYSDQDKKINRRNDRWLCENRMLPSRDKFFGIVQVSLHQFNRHKQDSFEIFELNFNIRVYMQCTIFYIRVLVCV